MYKKQAEHIRGKAFKTAKVSKTIFLEINLVRNKHTNPYEGKLKYFSNVKANRDLSINGVSITHLGKIVEPILHTQHQDRFQMEFFFHIKEINSKKL